MDYRHTEDFARRIEAAALRATALRAQAIDSFWASVSAGIRRALHALRHPLHRSGRPETMQPEA
jgi:hypothetical protein